MILVFFKKKNDSKTCVVPLPSAPILTQTRALPNICLSTMDSPRGGEGIHDPIQQLNFLAAEMSGVTIEEAYAIDGMNLGKKIPDYVLTQLCDTFYHKIYDDTDEANDW